MDVEGISWGNSLLYVKNRHLRVMCLRVKTSVRAKPFMCSAHRFGILMQLKLMYELKLETEAQGNSQMAYCTCIVPEQLVSTYHISPRVLI